MEIEMLKQAKRNMPEKEAKVKHFKGAFQLLCFWAAQVSDCIDVGVPQRLSSDSCVRHVKCVRRFHACIQDFLIIH